MLLKQNTLLLPAALGVFCIVLVCSSLNLNTGLNSIVYSGKTVDLQIIHETTETPKEKQDLLKSTDFHSRNYQIAIPFLSFGSITKPLHKAYLAFNCEAGDKPAYYSFLFRYTLF